MLKGMGKLSPGCTKSIFFTFEKQLTCAVLSQEAGEEQPSRGRKLGQTGPKQSAQADVQLKSSSTGLFTPHNSAVGWRGGG